MSVSHDAARVEQFSITKQFCPNTSLLQMWITCVVPTVVKPLKRVYAPIDALAKMCGLAIEK